MFFFFKILFHQSIPILIPRAKLLSSHDRSLDHIISLVRLGQYYWTVILILSSYTTFANLSPLTRSFQTVYEPQLSIAYTKSCSVWKAIIYRQITWFLLVPGSALSIYEWFSSYLLQSPALIVSNHSHPIPLVNFQNWPWILRFTWTDPLRGLSWTWLISRAGQCWPDYAQLYFGYIARTFFSREIHPSEAWTESSFLHLRNWKILCQVIWFYLWRHPRKSFLL
jgi:hypothetical protein